MIYAVLKSALYAAGRALSVLIMFAGLSVPMLAYGGGSGAQDQPVPQLGMFWLAGMAGVVVHGLGHLLACRALGAQVTAFQLGGTRAAIRFRAGRVKVSIGWPYRGRVSYTGALSVWRRAVFTLAGSLADLAFVGLLLVSWAALASWRGIPPLAFTAADALAVTGLVTFMPFRTRTCHRRRSATR